MDKYFKLSCASPSGLAWIKTPSGRKPPSVHAGSQCQRDNYWRVHIKRKSYYVHRIVYALYHNLSLKDLEGLVIDHLDGDRGNNKECNLILTTQQTNTQNRKCHREGHLVGTSYRKDSGKWRAYITHNGKRKYLGTFDTQEDAHKAYLTHSNSFKEI